MPTRAPTRGDPERRTQAQRLAQQAACDRSDRPNAVVDRQERAEEPGQQPLRHGGLVHRRAVDVEHHQAHAGDELGGEQHREDHRPRPARQRHQHQRQRKQQDAQRVDGADAEPPRQRAGDHRADQAADRGGPQHQPDRPGRDVQLVGDEQEVDRPEREVEQIDDGDRHQHGAQHRVAGDEPGADHHRSLVMLRGLGLSRVDRAQEARRDQERDRVHGKRQRAGDGLHQQPGDARADDEGRRAAAVRQRVRLDVVLALDQVREHGVVGHEEQHAEDAGQEPDDVHLLDRQGVERVGDRDRRQQQPAADVGGDHRPPLVRAAIDPGAGVQREDQVGDQRRRRQVPHLRWRRVQHEDGRQRQRDDRHLVAEHRHRLADPEPAEVAQAEGGRDPQPHQAMPSSATAASRSSRPVTVTWPSLRPGRGALP